MTDLEIERLPGGFIVGLMLGRTAR